MNRLVRHIRPGRLGMAGPRTPVYRVRLPAQSTGPWRHGMDRANRHRARPPPSTPGHIQVGQAGDADTTNDKANIVVLTKAAPPHRAGGGSPELPVTGGSLPHVTGLGVALILLGALALGPTRRRRIARYSRRSIPFARCRAVGIELVRTSFVQVSGP
jgi:hypothetical protein